MAEETPKYTGIIRPHNGWRRLDRQVVSTVANVDFTTGFTTTHKRYLVVCPNLTVDTDDRSILIRTDTNGGASFESGASDYNHACAVGFGAHTFETANDDSIEVPTLAAGALAGVGNAAGESMGMEMIILNPMDSSLYTLFEFKAVYHDGDGFSYFFGGGRRNTAEANNAIRILPESGNISGNFILFGWEDNA